MYRGAAGAVVKVSAGLVHTRANRALARRSAPTDDICALMATSSRAGGSRVSWLSHTWYSPLYLGQPTNAGNARFGDGQLAPPPTWRAAMAGFRQTRIYDI